MQEFWTSVNFQKAFLPKIWSILKKVSDPKSGYAHYCPYILPLFSKILEKDADNKHELAVKFLNNFQNR